MAVKLKYVGRAWGFANVKPGSAKVVDSATGVNLGRVKSYLTPNGAERWTALVRYGRNHMPIGTRASRREAGALVSWTARG